MAANALVGRRLLGKKTRCGLGSARQKYPQQETKATGPLGSMAELSVAWMEDRKLTVSSPPAADGWRLDRQARACAPFRRRRQGSGAPWRAIPASGGRLHS